MFRRHQATPGLRGRRRNRWPIAGVLAGVAVGCSAAWLTLGGTSSSEVAQGSAPAAAPEEAFTSRILELPPPSAGVTQDAAVQQTAEQQTTETSTGTTITLAPAAATELRAAPSTASTGITLPAPKGASSAATAEAGSETPAPAAPAPVAEASPAPAAVQAEQVIEAAATPPASPSGSAQVDAAPARTTEVTAEEQVEVARDVAAAATSSTRSPASGDVVASAAAATPAQATAAPAGDAALVIGFGPGQSRSDSAAAEAPAPATPRNTLRTVRVKVRKGDSLYSILRKSGVSGSVVPALLSGGDHGQRLQRLRPGQGIDLHLDASGTLARMDYRIDDLTTVSYRRDEGGFDSALTTLELESRKAHTSGTITSSLFLDGQRAGLSDRQIMQIAEIFGWDVDFAHDIRKGDRFTVVYEELLHKGKLIRSGDILAAEFVNRGKVLRAVRFVDPNGRAEYFTPEGLGMRKAFLRAPVKFGRISSRFNLRRRHPILHKIRAHRGVDYAARRGTPIMATGDARVESIGNQRGYGKTIVLRHGSSYTTLYAHMQKFARGMKKGKSVRQGEVIGYVGSSGLATGPHVHYEFRVRGVHKDPLKVKLPKSLPISPKLRRAFRNQTHKLVAMLDVYGNTSVAMR